MSSKYHQQLTRYLFSREAYKLLKKLNKDKVYRYLPDTTASDELITARFVDQLVEAQDADGYPIPSHKYRISIDGMEYLRARAEAFERRLTLIFSGVGALVGIVGVILDAVGVI